MNSYQSELTTQMRHLGYVPTIVPGFSDHFLMWKDTQTGKEFGFDGWELIQDFVVEQHGNRSPESELQHNATNLNALLYEKAFTEQEAYRDWLLTQPPEEILKHTYEYTVREDILMSLENSDLTDQQTAALLQSPSPLNDVFHDFKKLETGYMATLLECITDRANTLVEREQQAKEGYLNLPLHSICQQAKEKAAIQNREKSPSPAVRRDHSEERT